MPNRLFSIQNKISLLAGGCLILVVVLLISLSLYQTRTSTEQVKRSSSRMLASAAEQHMQAMGKVQRTFSQTYEYGQSLSHYLLFLRQRASPCCQARR